MSYNRLNWTANKPINTANLNAMDKGISDAHEALESIEKPIDYLSSSSTAPVQSKVMYTVVKNIERGNVTDEQLATAVKNYLDENPIPMLTESDKTDIARMVIESLGGNPVFGYVDENNNIIVSGKLADGTYSVKYEMEDGTTIDIGNLEFDSNVYYSVTNNLTNCTNSNSTTQAIAGNSYTATISAKSGYELSSISVTMGGADITSTAVNGGNINIANVTGDIVITAVSEETSVISFTNQLPLAVDSDDTPYEGTHPNGGDGYEYGYRVKASTGNLEATDGVYCSGFMPISSITDLIRIKNITENTVNDNYNNIVFYNGNKEFVYGLTFTANPYVIIDGDTYVIEPESWTAGPVSYFRFCCGGITDETIVTVNQEIV